LKPGRRFGVKLDDDLKKLISELGKLINDVIDSSPSLQTALKRLRRKGYNIFIVLEATMGGKRVPLNSKGNSDKWNKENKKVNLYRFEMTKSDRDFLRSLKISINGKQGKEKE
jgi:hypothetical protein